MKDRHTRVPNAMKYWICLKALTFLFRALKTNNGFVSLLPQDLFQFLIDSQETCQMLCFLTAIMFMTRSCQTD